MKIRFGLRSSKFKTYVSGFLLFFLGGIVLFAANSLLMGILSFLLSFAALYAAYLYLRSKEKDFFEINKTGIAYSYSGMKEPIVISWENITGMGYANPIGFVGGKTRWLGINLKDSSVVDRRYGKSKNALSAAVAQTSTDLAKQATRYDATIPDIFDVDRILPLMIKYWKNPQLREELDD